MQDLAEVVVRYGLLHRTRQPEADFRRHSAVRGPPTLSQDAFPYNTPIPGTLKKRWKSSHKCWRKTLRSIPLRISGNGWWIRLYVYSFIKPAFHTYLGGIGVRSRKARSPPTRYGRRVVGGPLGVEYTLEPLSLLSECQGVSLVS